MEKFRDTEEYYSLVNSVRKEYKPVFTNCYMYSSEAEKYIAQGRLLYEKLQGGILVYVDEMAYYRTYYYWNLSYPFIFQKKDKPTVIVELYSVAKNRKLLTMEEHLFKAGFRMEDKMRSVEADCEIMKKRLDKYLPMSERMFNGMGLKMMAPTMSMIPQIKECLAQMETIPFYELPYISDAERLTEGLEGRLICVVDKERKVCALWECPFANSTYGWSGILKEYRIFSGIFALQQREALLYAQKHNLNLIGWISEANTKSINAHMQIGFKWADRYMEYWILNAA